MQFGRLEYLIDTGDHMLLEAPSPFHQQAEDVGIFLAEDRARDLKPDDDRDELPEGPSENID